MNKFIQWFKTTPFYYWFVLVIGQSIIEIPRFGPIRDKIMDTLIAVIMWLIFSAIIGYGLSKSQFAQSLGIPSDFRPYLFVIFVLVFVRFVQNILIIPARTYFDIRKKQDRRIWEDIDILKKEIKGKKISNYGIEVKNNKAFDILRAHILVRYIEIDGTLYSNQEDYRLAQTSHENSSKLSWNGANPLEPTGIWIYKDGGSAFAYLFDVNRNNDEPVYKMRYFEFSEKDGKLMPTMRDVKNYMKCEFTCLVKYTLPDVVSGSDLYNLEIVIEGDRAKIGLNKGELSNKLPIEG